MSLPEKLPENTQSLYLAVFNASERPKTYSDIITSQSPKFLPFIKEYGNQALLDLFSITLTKISNLLRFETSREMLITAAELIIQDYPDTKLDDLKLFADDVIRGNIGGKLFGWDARTILECWADYYAKREDVFCDYREQRERQRQFDGSDIKNDALYKLSNKLKSE